MVREKQPKYLKAMDVEIWTKKKKPLSVNNTSKREGINCSGMKKSVEITANAKNRGEKKLDRQNEAEWVALRQEVSQCALCDLNKTHTNVVFGVGDQQADVMLIGEAPGANEDLQGEPFVGRAGMLLNAMLQAINLERSEVYIANILKCRPPNNRDPLPEEVAVCMPYLLRQIALIHPKVIIAVGRIAAQSLLNTNETMAHLRGKIFHYGEFNIPLFVIYHPAYLLRSPREKSKAYDDLLHIQKFVASQK